MRQRLIFGAALVGAVLCLSIPSPGAAAGAMHTLSPPSFAASPIEPVGWRRYCRRYRCGPVMAVPGGDIDVEVDVDAGAEVDVDVEAPAVIVLPPPRPLSCGQYRYWNGAACVDARYTDPYLGPR